MKKFCYTHRFYYDSVCPYCIKDRYAVKKDKTKDDNPGLTVEKIEELKRHFAQ